MEKNLTSWYSHRLQREMPVAVYGHYGFVLLMVPTAGADYLEYERFGLIDAIRPHIEGGKLKVYSVNSMNNESWMDKGAHPKHKTWIHNQFNHYIFDEIIPFIKNTSGQDTPIIICGASFGALHSMNLFLKRPDLLNGVVAMSGVYDLTEYSNGYFDEDVYYNSPQHYMPNLTDHGILEQIRRSRHIHLFSGSGPYEDPNASRSFASILYNKGINYELDIWGSEWPHDWNTWKTMLPVYLDTRF